LIFVGHNIISGNAYEKPSTCADHEGISRFEGRNAPALGPRESGFDGQFNCDNFFKVQNYGHGGEISRPRTAMKSQFYLLDKSRFAGCSFRMKCLASASRESAATANRWGKKLAAAVDAAMSRHQDADPEGVRLTLISPQSMPLAPLNRSQRRGRDFAAFRN